MEQANDIIFLWSHPRSVSSAMERIMLERGDMTTFHEPFIYLYYVHDAKKELAFFDIDPSHPSSYNDIKRMILDAAETQTVFVKDMCYYVADYILGDVSFLRRIKNTYLIRDPKQALTSYYKLDPNLSSEEVGLESQYRQFCATADLTGETPVVIDADDLLDNTEGVIKAYCQALHIPFLAHSLSWSDELPESWRHVAGWHKALQGSKTITKIREDEIKLEEIPNLQRLYDHHLPFYNKLKQHRLSF